MLAVMGGEWIASVKPKGDSVPVSRRPRPGCLTSGYHAAPDMTDGRVMILDFTGVHVDLSCYKILIIIPISCSTNQIRVVVP
jgi:hypothetical protein